MRHRRIAYLVLFGSASLFGCASGDTKSGGYGPYGGQTGSLTPQCGVAPLTNSGAPVAAGSSIAVVYTAGCSSLSSISVVGPDGQPVPSSLEPLDDFGTYIVRADAPIAAGGYDIVLPASGSEHVTVVNAAPLPTSLGTLTQRDEGTCAGAFYTLTLDPSALPYVSLIGLEASIDNNAKFTWVPFGALDLQGNTSTLELYCSSGDCNLDGDHYLTVTATIAGEPAPFDTLDVSFTASCPPPAAPACTFSPRGPVTPTAALFALLTVFTRLVRRRRKRPRG